MISLCGSGVDDGAAIEFEERAGDAFENRNPQEILGFESLRVRTNSDRGAHHTFVGERTRGAGHHALAAGNAGGIAIGELRSKAMPAE